MRLSILLVTFSLVAWLGSCSPLNPKRILINHPTDDMLYNRSRRSLISSARPLPEYRGPTKEGLQIPRHDHRGLPRSHDNISPTAHRELNVRKGEYICGDRVCKLQPGEVPKNCNGICQYPIA